MGAFFFLGFFELKSFVIHVHLGICVQLNVFNFSSKFKSLLMEFGSGLVLASL